MLDNSSKLKAIGGERYGYLRELALPLLIILAIPLFFILNGESFLSSVNIGHIGGAFVPLGLTALGAFIVARKGQVDLSIGSTIGFSAFISALLLEEVKLHPLPVILLVLLIGVLIGAFNGLLISLIKLPLFLPSLIVTFITMFALRYGFWAISGRKVITFTNEIFTLLFGHELVKVLLVIAGLLTLAAFNGFQLFISRGQEVTRGKVIRMVLVSVVIAALFAFPLLKGGIAVNLLYLLAAAALISLYLFAGKERGALLPFALSGALAALAALVISERMSGASPYAGGNFELNSLLILFLAGGSLFSRPDCVKNADLRQDQGATSLKPGAYNRYVRTAGVGATKRLAQRCFFTQSGRGTITALLGAALFTALAGSGLQMTGVTLFANQFVKMALLGIFLVFDYLIVRKFS